MKAINRQRAKVVRARIAIRSRFAKTFIGLRKSLGAVGLEIEKAKRSSSKYEAIVVDTFDNELEAFLQEQLTIVATDGAALGLGQVGVASKEAMDGASSSAAKWARENAGEKIKGITETTREGIADLVERALAEGWSNQELSQQIASSYGLSVKRADVIARTETAAADIQGNIEAYKQIGAKVKWLTAKDDKVSMECNGNDEEVREIGEPFPSGAYFPPQHPNCRCDVVPVLDEE